MTEQAKNERNVKPLIIIVVIAVATTLIPYVMYLTGLGIPQGTTNNGILLEDPFVVTDFNFRDAEGEPWELEAQAPKFRLVIPVVGECDQACRETLVLTRQVRTRLSRHRDQLERVFVQLGERELDPQFAAYLESEHPDLRYVQGNEQEWRQALADEPELGSDFRGGEYYLLHRYGALAMAYNDQHTGNELLDDLEFLIKTSN